MIPPTGLDICGDNCVKVSILLAFAFMVYTVSLLLTIIIQMLIGNEKTSEPISNDITYFFIMYALYMSVGWIVMGFTLLSVVVLYIQQRAAGWVTVSVVCMFYVIVLSWFGMQ